MSEQNQGFRREIAEIGVGVLGYAFMGKSHSAALRQMPAIFWPPPAVPKLLWLAGRSESAVKEAAQRYGYQKATTDWQDIVEDPDTQVFINLGPNDTHAEPCIAAARSGKHVLCEKPLARTAEEAKRMLEAVEKAGIKHACAFNYRFVPAIQLARKLLEEGALGEIYHFRAQYLQDWITDPSFPRVWRLSKKAAGSGALGDLSHIVDLARYLIGEPRTVSAITKTFIKQRPLPGRPNEVGEVDVDDAFCAVVEYDNGAIGTLEASRMSNGRKNYEVVEINGSKGSLWWNLEKLNELHVYFKEDSHPKTLGFREVLVSEVYHPFHMQWWPDGHILGWGDTFISQAANFFDAIVNDKSVAPYQATFDDGYRACVVTDAILESAQSGRRVEVKY